MISALRSHGEVTEPIITRRQKEGEMRERLLRSKTVVLAVKARPRRRMETKRWLEGANNRHTVKFPAVSILSVQRQADPCLKIGRNHSPPVPFRRATFHAVYAVCMCGQKASWEWHNGLFSEEKDPEGRMWCQKCYRAEHYN